MKTRIFFEFVFCMVAYFLLVDKIGFAGFIGLVCLNIAHNIDKHVQEIE